MLDEKAFVNGIVGLMATGGSTNLVLHMPAMARAAGVRAIGVSWGYHAPAELLEYGACGVADTMAELEALIDG